MVDHDLVAKYFPEAYDGEVKFQDKELPIVEIANTLNYFPILKRYGEWAVTTNGLSSLTVKYNVTKDRFDEDDWIDHMEGKTWVNMNDFKAALAAGKDFVKFGII
jgi:hypothetical protein